MHQSTLDPRSLGRALLARQHLLEPLDAGPAEVIRHLVVLQAQVPVDPYVALWTRIRDFDPGTLSDLIEQRGAVRATLHRATIHLALADDALSLYPVLVPVLERMFRSGSPFGRRLVGVDVERAMRDARRRLDERPRTRAELRDAFATFHPDADGDALAMAVSLLLPTVQVPPRGLWARSGAPRLATLDGWLGRAVGSDTDPTPMVLRYLAAYGPASVMDVQAWCGLTRLGEVLERSRADLRTYRSVDGRELFDLPDAPRPHPDTPAPVRFLPQYDDVLLGHADRSRIVPTEMAARAGSYPTQWVGTLLVDGLASGLWRVEDGPDTAVLQVELVRPMSATELDELASEGERLVAFLRPRVSNGSVRIVDRIP